ncbi:MAG TPA: DUF294 nucleotidyltransferase-like domain-containing protein [Steroidobacteraceae bacterium]|nr:DUF294 nucleotidyltransferase-like domain-containing protein [Steroidobacteraceae bacterium]
MPEGPVMSQDVQEAVASLVRDISGRERVADLAALAARTTAVVGALVAAGAPAGRITHAISRINDRLAARVLELTETRLGRTPAPYCWILFGSEGRREQTFKTDQDNALVYGDTPDAAEEVRGYFGRFAQAAIANLIAIGFPRCPAGYMASTPAWCQPLSVWTSNFSTWVTEPVPDHLLKFLVFCDFRPLHGRFELAVDLREHVRRVATGERRFLGHLANTVLEFTPPLGMFRTFLVERNAEHKGRFDLKLKGMTPLVSAVRFLAISHGITETGTLERLQALRDLHALAPAQHDELAAAFECVMSLRIRHQYEQVVNGSAPDNFIDPDGLSRLERKRLKESFAAMSRVQAMILELNRAFVH